MLDKYVWSVVYDDGSVTTEAEAQGWSNVEEERVKEIRLSSDARGAVSFSCHVPEGAKPIFFRRFRQEFNPNAEEQAASSLYAVCIGHAHDDEDQSLLFICADGRIVLTDSDIN